MQIQPTITITNPSPRKLEARSIRKQSDLKYTSFGRSNLCTDSQIKPAANKEDVFLKFGSGPCEHDWGSALMVEENKRLKVLKKSIYKV